MTEDPFGTGRLREAVLAAWTAQPARFREDANAEEDHARGGYRDRVVVELAQNAADAASRAGAAGSLLLRLVDHGDGGLLLAANTGAALDAEGVASLASLRASAKRDEGTAGAPGGVPTAPVGRFGVGFSAVRSVADDVAVASRAGAVHFSLARTRDAVAGTGVLGDELARRGDALPALRLPWPGPLPAGEAAEARDLVGTDGAPVGAWDTVVVLVLRDAAAVSAVRVQLEDVADPLLLALPALGDVVVEADGAARTVRDVRSRWVVATRTGAVGPRLLVDRPVEERARTTWSVTWAVPRPSTRTSWAPVVHAPTPTDEPCTVPALVLATFPLDPSRRHVARGPLTDVLLEEAGRTYADLLLACHRDDGAPDVLDLVPGGLPSGALDAALRAQVLAAAAAVPVLLPADGGPALAPRDAAVLAGPAGDDPDLLPVLGRRVPRLVPAPTRHRAALRALGVEELDASDVVEALPPLDPPEHRGLLDAAAGAEPAVLEALATLLVPLADGRHVRGARGLTVLDGAVDDDVLGRLADWGLRVVHPAAAHPLHERLGAERLTVTDLLRHPVLRGHVLTGDDEEATADVLLALLDRVAADGGAPHAEAWWGELLLPADDGEPSPARGLVLPGSDAGRWFAADVLPPVADDVVARWGRVLALVGVRTGLAVVDVPVEAYDAFLPAGDDPHHGAPHDDLALVLDALDGWEDYLDEVRPAAGPQRAVADLDAVVPAAWPEVLRALATAARPALLDRVRDADGAPCPTYVAWWLRTRAGLGLERPFRGEEASAGPLDALLPRPPGAVVGLDGEVLRALGAVGAPEDLGADDWAELLATLPLDGEVELALAVPIWRALAGLAAGDPQLDLEVDRVPALVGDGEVRTVPAGDVVVVTLAQAQHPAARPAVVVPGAAVEALADALGADVAADRFDLEVDDDGVAGPVPDAVRAVFPTAPAVWVEHEDLRVGGASVAWWVTAQPSPVVHAATTDGLADGLAEVVGRRHRDRLARLLSDPDELAAVLLETAAEDLPER
ncbi:sacsin N-terminal ATP-binding-like domain-containing protein [Actinotalea sp. Marseille-Q4924]|uniref:sacsin N-terminal ATP-binding-like domain-containing protein n=1 Tax=Actinotalea sp. Marseille-Q4924 TaxID=2866571 RepID=UPI001CE43EA2|nr:ATP-binding protein [Actinotalea sp. Marseille-Q4924]